MKLPIYNLKAENIGELTLPKLFSTECNDKLVVQAVRVYLNNQRKSHAVVKQRGDVTGTSAKMWPQKGTGRARHSSAKAPQFVGGGSAHGPQGNQSFKLSLPKAQKKLAINTMLTRFAKTKKIMIIDEISKLEAKTKIADKLITCLSGKNEVLSKSRRIGIITSKPLDNVKRAFNNLPGIDVLNLNSLNIFNLASQKFLIFTKEAINDIK